MSEEIPPYIFFNGEVVPWEQAKVHVWSEVAIRATNVFEGVRGYWNEDKGTWQLVSWPRHRERLMQSARLMRMPHQFPPEDFDRGIADLLHALDYRTHVYIRPTIFVEKGRYDHRPENVTCGNYIAIFPVPRSGHVKTSKCMVSSWRRFGDLSGAPPRIKAGANYQNLRFPRIEANVHGVDDAILLNDRDTVAEFTGAALFIIRGKKLITPPFSSGILESITRDNLMSLAAEEFGLEVVEREVDRTELYVSDEILSAGTLSEISAVTHVDGLPIGDGTIGPVTSRLAARYGAIVLGQEEDPYGWTTQVAPRSR